LKNAYDDICRRYKINIRDTPNIEDLKQFLVEQKLNSFSVLTNYEKQLLDEAILTQLPSLLSPVHGGGAKMTDSYFSTIKNKKDEF